MRESPTSALEESWVRTGIGPQRDSNSNLPLVLELSGAPNLKAVRLAVEDLTARHEALRTRFTADGSVRVVVEALDVELAEIDLSASPLPEAAAEGVVLGEVAALMSLTIAPLWRVVVLRLAPDRLWLVFVLSHAISDGWTMGVLRRDFVRCYSARVGARSGLPALSVQPSDIARAEKAMVVSGEDLAYWQTVVPGLPQDLSLDPLPEVGVMAHVPIPQVGARDVAVLVDAAREIGVGPGGAMRAAVLTALSPMLGDGVICGALVAARTQPTFGVVGVLADHQVFRVDLADNPSYLEVVRRVHGALRLTRQRVPYRVVAPRLGGELPAAILDVGIMYLPGEAPRMYLPGEVRPLRADDGTEIREVAVSLSRHRPMGARGCPGLTALSHTVRHGTHGISGEVYGCAGPVGAARLSVAHLQQRAGEFAETVARIARQPHGRVRSLSAAGG